MPMEPIRNYRDDAFCKSCNQIREHLFFEEKFIPGGVRLQIKRVCQTCYDKAYRTFRTDGSVEEAGAW